MDSLVKKLRQEQAFLGARQGDPTAPASGTLLARRTRLCAHLEEVEAQLSGPTSPRPTSPQSSSQRPDTSAPTLATHRAALALRQEIGKLTEEIDRADRRIHEIDRLIADACGLPEPAGPKKQNGRASHAG